MGKVEHQRCKIIDFCHGRIKTENVPSDEQLDASHPQLPVEKLDDNIPANTNVISQRTLFPNFFSGPQKLIQPCIHMKVYNSETSFTELYI